MRNEKKRIIVYDDETNSLTQYTKRLQKLKPIKNTFIVETLDNDKFTAEIEVLLNRQKNMRKGIEWNDVSLLDTTSILIIDYDLLKSLNPPSFFTGEIFAYLTRCFSKCDLIIGMNQYGVNPFDLTLKGHLDSYADLNIGSVQLDNLGLWSDVTKGFRPWYWPHLPQYLEKNQKRISDVMENYEDSIVDILGIKDVARHLPRSVSEFLGGDLRKVIFRDFVLKSGNGLRGRRDKKASDVMIARIGAARISKWLERWVLPGQDILIDAPHLVARFPSLLIDDASKISVWNETVRCEPHKELNLDHEKIVEAKYVKSYWLSKPVWFWNKISNNLKIIEVKEPWKKKNIKYVFCEDASRFYKIKDCREFISDTESPYIKRYIRYFKSPRVAYRPRVRLLS